MTERCFLLCTDLDRTLLPNGPQPESDAARPLFARLVEQPDLGLAYVSGRDLSLVDAAIGEYGLPVPDFALTDVGTRIFVRRDRDWHVCEAWSGEIAQDWGGLGHAALARLVADVEEIEPQEGSKQGAFKASFYFPADVDIAGLETRLLARIRDRGGRLAIVLSIDEVANVGLCDIVPASATKLHAIEFLRRQLGLGVGQTLFAGDSGNDLGVLASDIPAVLVANASAEVRQAALARARAAGTLRALYCARGGYLGLNGNYAAGILEGLAHFAPERARLLERAPA